MNPLWRRSLLFRTVSSIVSISLIVGGLIMLVLSSIVAHQGERDAYGRLNELLDTVESTVRIACFVGNEELAKEVANGLLKNREVSAVSIHSDQAELARLARNGRPAKNGNSAQPLERRVYSPFDTTSVVGRIQLIPDIAVIDTQVKSAQQHMAIQMGLLIIAVGIALTLTVLRQVIRPVNRLSRRLASLDAASGERLKPPDGHEANVFGTLTQDINTLSGRLVATIEAEKTLRAQHEIDELKYRSIFDNAESGIFIAGKDGECTSCNRSFARLTGLPGNPQQINLCRLGWQDDKQLAEMIATCLAQRRGLAEDLELNLAPASQRWLHVALTPISDDTVQGIVSDITARKMSEMNAQRMAITDPLTGLPNRQGFENRWSCEIADHPDRPFALLIINLEGFKQINDALGFPVGDKVLTGMGARIVTCIKADDTVARLGGDEFVVILPEITKDSAIEKVSQRIVAKLCETFLIDGQDASLGASIGAARYPRDGADLPTLLRNAELALAQARSSGGRTCRLFDQQMIHAIEHRHQLGRDLRHAAERGELRLFYQPIVRLGTQEITGAESLIRWQHPGHGMIPPDSFIPLAEETGVIDQIGLWCLDTACAQLAQWQAEGYDFRLTINVSARQIPDGLPPQALIDATGRHGISPAKLGLEITESVLMGDSESVHAWLEAVRKLGFSTYLDDFGTGYSSLSYLKRFPIDTIKIDKAFIRDMTATSNDRVMVEAVVMMAESLSLTVVAEGIENPDQFDILNRMGCTFGQGYHISRPVPPEQFPLPAKATAPVIAEAPAIVAA